MKGSLRSAKKNSQPIADKLSDGDNTPPKNNRTDIIDGSFGEGFISEDLAEEIENTRKTFTENNLDDISKPHSAQAQLQKSLNPQDFETRMERLKALAAEKAALRKERAIAKREKKRKEQALAASKKAAATKSAAAQVMSSQESSASSSSSESENSSDDTEYGKKQKSSNKSSSMGKTQKLNQNTYAILTANPSSSHKQSGGLSKAAKKRQKKIKRPHQTYFCVKLQIKKSTDPMNELLTKSKQWFDYLRTVDETAILYPYKDTEPTTARMSSSSIPDSLAPFKNYFQQASLRLTEGHTWINVYVGHTESSDDIVREMVNYKNDTNTFTFVKKLQAKYVSKEYFLIWSTDYIDVDKLTSELHKRIAKITKETFQFAFTWSEIKGINGTKYLSEKKDRWRKDTLSALHIQVPEERKDATYDMLSRFFGLDTTHHIFGREMLMVPILKKTNTEHKNTNIEKLIQKHAHFYAKLEYASSDDFVEIDRKATGCNRSIRDMVMELTTLDGHQTQLFWSIDADKKRWCISPFLHLLPRLRET